MELNLVFGNELAFKMCYLPLLLVLLLSLSLNNLFTYCLFVFSLPLKFTLNSSRVLKNQMYLQYAILKIIIPEVLKSKLRV